MRSRIYQLSYKRCANPAHAPFRYWRREVREQVCDCCNWDTAYMGGQGRLWCYPLEVQQALQQALAERSTV